jgi:hypothetical protein
LPDSYVHSLRRDDADAHADSDAAADADTYADARAHALPAGMR